MSYRATRNIEASIIDFLKAEFTGSWSDVNIEKSFARVYDIALPVVCIRAKNTTHEYAEIGDNKTWRRTQVLIDIFAKSDGQKEDLTDFVIEKIKNGCPYYNYTITNGVVSAKVSNGRIRVIRNPEVTQINFDDEKGKLDIHDRYRSLINLELSLGKVE